MGGTAAHLPLHLLIHARAKLLGDSFHAALALPLARGFFVDPLHARHEDGLPQVQVCEGSAYSHLHILTAWLLLFLLLAPKATKPAKPAKHPTHQHRWYQFILSVRLGKGLARLIVRLQACRLQHM